MNDIKDIKGQILKVGDKVIMGGDWARGCVWLKIGIVEKIDYKPVKTIATINIIKNGLWNYGKDDKPYNFEKIVRYEIPRIHDNLYIIES